MLNQDQRCDQNNSRGLMPIYLYVKKNYSLRYIVTTIFFITCLSIEVAVEASCSSDALKPCVCQSFLHRQALCHVGAHQTLNEVAALHA